MQLNGIHQSPSSLQASVSSEVKIIKSGFNKESLYLFRIVKQQFPTYQRTAQLFLDMGIQSVLVTTLTVKSFERSATIRADVLKKTCYVNLCIAPQGSGLIEVDEHQQQKEVETHVVNIVSKAYEHQALSAV